jgi:hypothetical protein
MPGPFDNGQTVAAPNLEQPIISAYQQGVSPAIAALQDAFEKGLLTSEQIKDLSTVTPKARRAKMASLDLSAQQSQAQMANNLPQLQAQSQAADINAGLQVLPSRTSAAIAQNTAAGSQASLQGIQIGAATPSAQLEAGEMQRDPTGVLTATRKLYSQYAPLTGQAIPRAPDGQIDYDKMQKQLQEAYFPGSTADGSPHADVGLQGMHNMLMSQLWSGEYGKQVSAMAKEKNQESLMYDANGRLQSPYVAGPLIGKAEVKPKLTSEQVVNAASKLPSEDASLGLINEARGLVSKDGVVGQQISGGANIVNQKWTGVKAAMGYKEAIQKDNDRTRLEQTLGAGILDSIRSLSGTGAGRVLEKEFEVMQKQTVPALDAGREVWNKWLNEREDLIHRAQVINQQIAAGKLPGAPSPNDFLSNQVSHATAPAPQNNGNASLPKVMTQADYDALKPGMKYVDSAGNVATKRGQ